VASGRSAWLLLGYSGMAFVMGLSAIWATLGYIVAEALLFLTMGRRLRTETARSGDITIPDYFASRFPGQGQRLRVISAILITFFLTAYISAQLLAAGKAFNSSFDLSITGGIILASLIILIYTLLGGFLAVALTDVIQGLLMTFALIGIPALVLLRGGGFSWIFATLSTIDGSLLSPFNIGLGAMVSFVAIGLGSAGSPHILVRYMSAKEDGDLIKAAIVGTSVNILMAAGATLTGLTGRVLYFFTLTSQGG